MITIPSGVRQGTHRSAALAVAFCAALAIVHPDSSAAVERTKIVVKGRITAVDTNLPLAGARVKIDGLGKARTNSKGRFVIRSSRRPVGSVDVTIRARGFVPRSTRMVVPAPGGTARESWNLLPKASDGFDLKLFNAIARPSGVIRWESPPTIRIVRNQIECRGGLLAGDTGTCPDWFATTDPVSPRLLAWLRSAAAAMRAMGAQSGRLPRVVEVDLSPGQSINRSALLEDDTFTLGEVKSMNSTLRSTFPQFAVGQPAIKTRAVLYGTGLLVSLAQRDVHGLVAHGLGFYGTPRNGGCDDVIERGLSSFFCDRALLAPTALDKTAARALYSRAIGNRAPDADPQ